MADRCLGADVRFSPVAVPSAHVEVRVKKALEAANKIAGLPLPMEVRGRLMATQPCAAAFYGVEVTQLSTTHIAALEAAALRVLWGVKRTNRCKEIVLTVLAPGHQIDPQQALAYRRLVGLVRMLQRRPDLRDLVQMLLGLYQPGRRWGPVHLAMEALYSLGWSWTPPWHVVREGIITDLLVVDPGTWAHEVREAARMVRWKAASSRRTDMVGLTEGVDKDATNAAWRRSAGYEAGVLRGIIAGAVWTQDRLFRAGMKDTPLCPHCSAGVTEDLEHMWWGCAAWDGIRSSHPAAMADDRLTWPPCLALCGIMVNTVRADAVERKTLAMSVQWFMAQILQTRYRPSDLGPSLPRHPSHPEDFPWGWNPPGCRISYAAAFKGLAPPKRWRYGKMLFTALNDYLSRLEWPLWMPTRGITFVELAMDFEVATGVSLPAAPRRDAGAQASPPVADRAQAFAAMLKALDTHAAPRPLHGGSRTPRARSLQPLGLTPTMGLTERPVLVGGSATEAVLRQLGTVAHRNTSVPHGHHAWACAWTQHFTPTHSAERVDRTEEWQRRAELAPSPECQLRLAPDLQNEELDEVPRQSVAGRSRACNGSSDRGGGRGDRRLDGRHVSSRGPARVSACPQKRNASKSPRTRRPGCSGYGRERGRGRGLECGRSPGIADHLRRHAGHLEGPVSPRPGDKRLAGPLPLYRSRTPHRQRFGERHRCGDKRRSTTREMPRPLKRVRHGRGAPEAVEQ